MNENFNSRKGSPTFTCELNKHSIIAAWNAMLMSRQIIDTKIRGFQDLVTHAIYYIAFDSQIQCNIYLPDCG